MNDAVLGALVADAASLGLHWIYDPERVRAVGGDAPEFVEPDLANYRGTTAYFAHKGKRAGDPSHYGEQLSVLLRSLDRTGGVLDVADYERRFVESFGPGGTWVGYVDFATRETLRNIDRAERDALDTARAFDLGEFEGDRSLMEAAVMANVRWSGDKLRTAMEKAVRIRRGDNPALAAAALRMAEAVRAAGTGVHGADDAQLPAVVKLPALPGGADWDTAVRVTNDNDDAVRWAGHVMRLLQTGDLAASAAGELLLEEALRFDGDAAEHFGRACPLHESIPLTFALLRDAPDFKAGVRSNILAGGDSCGRAILVGAVLGARHGVPEDWIEKTFQTRTRG
ncbi:MAG: ADP-ribosylglycohydrolase family protein [Planctomycetota bacterium]|jgi:hypothetical protein